MSETVQEAPDRTLPHAEQLRLAARIAVTESIGGDPKALGELWCNVEELRNRAVAAKDTAAKIAATGKAAEQEADELASAILGAILERDLEKADAGYGIIKVEANGGNQAVRVIGSVPPEYTKSKTTVSNDLTKIGDALRKGDILTFAVLEPRGSHLSLEAF